MLKNLYANRRYLLGSFWTDLRYRYAGTSLGFFWFIVNPLLEVTLYAIIFTQIVTVRSGAGKGISYTLFLTTGLFPFLAFSQMISRGSNAIVANAVYMRRSLIPAEVFVFKEAMIATFSLLIYLIFLIPISLIADNPLTSSMLITPVLALLLVLLGFGISLPLANLRVLFPDLTEIIGVVLQLWRWTLPIMYTDKNFPDWLRHIMSINPPYFFIRSFRDIMIEHQMPSIYAWLFMGFWIVVLIALAQWVSRHLRHEVKDLI
jgi:ABC-type polysaccharide/polyol phosphate export permease